MSNSNSKLAIFGGEKTLKTTLKVYNPIGNEELEIVKKVIKSGKLSEFIGSKGDGFSGGKYVKEFESNIQNYFSVKHAITFNSWTSGLIAAVGALGIEPGDEIILSPWTMSACAMAILHWNAIPVFADIEEDTFCIDPKSIEKNISQYTKAIIAIDIAGQSADVNAINKIAKKYSLKVISDTAQAPGAIYHDNYAGTQTDIGGFSFNYHKHINTGEGGVAVTNSDALANKLRLIRNHAESVVDKTSANEELINMIGFNFRMGEIESAIGIEQLKKLNFQINRKQEIASLLDKNLRKLDGLSIPVVRSNSTHVYYAYTLKVDEKKLNIKRSKIKDALVAEGVTALSTEYCNLHLLPLFQKKIAYGKRGFPWKSEFCKRDISYEKGICPIAEKLNEQEFLGFGICAFDYTDDQIFKIIEAFKKVWKNLDFLRKN